jgi:hypothetical protein
MRYMKRCKNFEVLRDEVEVMSNVYLLGNKFFQIKDI